MKKLVITFVSLFLFNICLGQFSSNINIGVGQVARDIPNGHFDRMGKALITLNILYQLDSMHLAFGIACNWSGRNHFEQHSWPTSIAADYNNPFMVLGIIGVPAVISPYFKIFGQLQAGYSHSQFSYYLESYENGNYTYKGYTKQLQQFVIGANFGILLGRRRAKGVIQLAHYYFSAPFSGSYFTRESMSYISIGFSYLFVKRKYHLVEEPAF